jgi:glycosyltransferase involved in cell wall biosynthesis
MEYRNKHILVLVSGSEVATNLNLTGGIFQLNQVKILSNYYKKVSFLSSGFLTFPNEFKKHKYQREETQDRLKIFKIYKKLFLPKRFFSANLLFKLHIKLALNQFEQYISINGKPDIIHAHNIIYSGLVAQIIKDKYNIPFIITEHSSIYIRNQYNKYLELINQKMVFNSNLYAVSDMFSLELKKILKLDEVGVISNVLAPSFSNPYQYKKDKNAYTFISIGNFTKNKNHILIIKSFLEAFNALDNVRLILVGKGPEKNRLTSLIKNSGRAKQFKIFEYLDHNEIKELLHESDCFVLSSNFETFGVVVIEAMACGLPVISTKCIGPEDILNQNCGILIEKNNSVQMVESMKQIINSEKLFVAKEIRNYAIDNYGEVSFLNKIDNIYNLFWDE